MQVLSPDVGVPTRVQVLVHLLKYRCGNSFPVNSPLASAHLQHLCPPNQTQESIFI